MVSNIYRYTLYCLFCFSVGGGGGAQSSLSISDLQPPDIPALITAAQINSVTDNWHYQNEYKTVEKFIRIDKNGRKITRTYEFYCSQTCFFVWISENGKPRPSKKVDKERRKIARKLTKQRRSALETIDLSKTSIRVHDGLRLDFYNGNLSTNLFLDACKIKFLEYQEVNQRKSLKFTFSNCNVSKYYAIKKWRKLYKNHLNFMLFSSGYLYIDLKDKRVSKLQVYKKTDFEKSHFNNPLIEVEFIRVPSGFWFTKRFKLNRIGNKSHFRYTKENNESVFLEYKRYSVEAGAKIDDPQVKDNL